MRFPGKTKLKTHLRVTHEVAILFAIVSYGNSSQSNRPRLRCGLDDKGHIRRVLDLEVERGPVASGPLKDAKNGLTPSNDN